MVDAGGAASGALLELDDEELGTGVGASDITPTPPKKKLSEEELKKVKDVFYGLIQLKPCGVLGFGKDSNESGAVRC